ncbi:MAG: hypothetical protein Q4Q58_04050 [Thermoplasmata archaeon]|nr:hypothetical protein [Thermoplasmata archaeon]
MGIFCLMLLVVLYGSVLYTRDNSNVQRMFRWTLLASIATVCSDILWGFTYDGSYGASASWAVNIIYTVSESMTYLLWAMHYRASHADFPKGRMLVPWVLPAILAIAMCITSMGTGAYISIDSSGVYTRGPLHGLYTLIVSLPVIVVTLESMWRMARSHRRSEIMREATLAGFILPLVGCAVVQILWYDLPALAIGLTLSLLVVYINTQNMKITEDPITGLSNRFRMGVYLESRFDECRNWGGILHLAVMDLDHFTAIVAANPPPAPATGRSPWSPASSRTPARGGGAS